MNWRVLVGWMIIYSGIVTGIWFAHEHWRNWWCVWISAAFPLLGLFFGCDLTGYFDEHSEEFLVTEALILLTPILGVTGWLWTLSLLYEIFRSNGKPT